MPTSKEEGGTYIGNGLSGLHIAPGADVEVSGVCNASGNGLDGIHIAAGATAKMSGEFNTHNNGRHGLYIAGEYAVATKQNVEAMEHLLGLPELSSIREDVIPLLIGIKQELEKPQPEKTVIRNGYAQLNEYLKGINQSLIASGIFHALDQLAHHGQSLFQ